MKLKDYQKETLATLERFFEEARVLGPKAAYEAITNEPEQKKRLRSYAGEYTPVPGLPEVPYVCLRLPTGGGKTILAAHSITRARDRWIETEFPLVLWLVPTNTIRMQTAEALKSTRHPYRKALDETFDGRVRVFDIGDFEQITPQDLRSHLCVVVGTIQTLRTSSTDGRKVYAHNEAMEPHFTRVPDSMPGLERNEESKFAGKVRYSFANLLHLNRPLVIMDEAHKSSTSLTEDVYERINPTALIEFTATPRSAKHNILHSVTAQELKDEEMIKMPVVLEEAKTWQGAVNAAILKRAELQEHAARDRGYIRPIVLFQAQNKNEEVTVDVLKEHLIDVENIDPDKIAVATGAQRELDGINLFDPECPIEYVITIEALKEGWDCSFAYVFCSVANIKSATDAEQLLGRVLRMPYAKRRKAAALNKSYAKLVSPAFAEAAQNLRDKLVNMGFEETEAEANIEAEQPELEDGLFGYHRKAPPSVSIETDATEDEVRAMSAAVPKKVAVKRTEAGAATVEIRGYLKPREREALLERTPERHRKGVEEAIAKWDEDNLTEVPPAHAGETFVIPRLMSEQQGELVFADTDILMEYHPWSLTDHPARLTPKEFSVRETGQNFEIDLDGNHVTISAADTTESLFADVDVEDWSPPVLVRWLDGKVRDPWISQSELQVWLSDVVNYLIRDRGIPLSQLMRCKFILARKLGEKIAEYRAAEHEKVYQANLFGEEAPVAISFDQGFEFFDGMYDDVPKFRGTVFKFRRHFAGSDEIPAFDGVEAGEEQKCAMVLDSLAGLKYWTRNVSRHRNSFWLPLAHGKFYPDFVALMEDGRLLVVEYKGADRTPDDYADSRRKLQIGEQWQKVTKGRGVFVMATMKDGDPNEIRQQIMDALERS